MPFAVSPGVNVSEIDLTTVVPAVSSTEGAIGGVFRWGPVGERVLVSTESELQSRFGKPTNLNAETFFTAASFLAYGNKLYVSRAFDANTVSAVANTDAVSNVSLFTVKNEDDYEAKVAAGTFGTDTDVKFVARSPGLIGNSLKISICDSSSAYNQTHTIASTGSIDANLQNTSLSISVGSNTALVKVANSGSGTAADALARANTILQTLSVGDVFTVGNTTIGKQFLKVKSIPTNPTQNATHSYFSVEFDGRFTLSTDFVGGSVERSWEYFNSVDGAPGQSEYQTEFGNTSANDEVHVVVVDAGGSFTGTPGTILEVFERLSRATNAKTNDGATNYYGTVLNQVSQYVWFGNDLAGAASNTAALLTSSTNTKPTTIAFGSGTDTTDESTVAVGALAAAYDLFSSPEAVDVSLIMTGKARGGTNGEQMFNYLIDNIAEVRRDCVVFGSPDRADVVNNVGQELDAITAFRNSTRSTSYAVLDSGYKYMYDKYNDVYRYVPLNGDIAGLCVRTDRDRDPWWSPGGFNRGQIKNIVKLAFNPQNEAQRDILYKQGVNPVVTFPGQGTVLYGDKTLLSKPSAFDRINVRRLFIVLEKAIATAAKFTLFEFNDEFTRAQFRNLVEPFLRDVQGRRGIIDYRVVCDGTNNTGEVIDRNEFVGDIYIKPARSINFIQLNFVAVRTGVEFTEIVGQF